MLSSKVAKLILLVELDIDEADSELFETTLEELNWIDNLFGALVIILELDFTVLEL